MDFRLGAAGRFGLARRFSRLAGFAGLDSGDARSALDDSHYRSSRRAACRRRPLSRPLASELSRRHWRDRHIAALLRLALAVSALLPRQCRYSIRAHTRRECGVDRIAECRTSLSKNSKPVTASVSIGFGMMCVGMFMAILDVQVVATSLPTIQSALAIPPDRMSWVQTAYLIAEVIAIPLTGFLTRALTMRWLFVLAISVFTLASLGCAASESFAALIAWRILQGFSGGTLIPAVFSAVFLLFPISRQSLATTFAGVLAVLAPTVGPVVGGWITQTYSWHWLFLINIIPGIISAILAAVLLPSGRDAIERCAEARHPVAVLVGDGFGHSRNRAQGSPPARMEFQLRAGPACAQRRQWGGLRQAHSERRATDRRSQHIRRSKFHDRLRPEFCLGHRPVRLDLSHAGLSRLRPGT